MSQKRVSATVQVTGIIDGENSIRIDLDNQQDIISLDGEGKVRFARTIVVHARIFDGQHRATTGVALDGTESSLRTALTIGDCTPTIFFSQGILTVTWQFAKGMSATAVNKTIALLYNDIRHDATFTLATTDAEILYQLRPSPSEVSFSINEDDNSFTPAYVFLTCGYVKETGSGKTVYDNPNTSKIDSSNYLYYRTRTGNAWGSWQSYSQALRVDSTTEVTDYEFCISSASSAAGVSDSNITDAEVVPVVRGGKNGDGIKKVTRSYAVSSVGSVASDTTEPEHHGSWSSGSPAVSEQYPYLWCREVTEYKYAASVTRYFLVGARGNNGVDAQDIEWAYIRTKNYVAPEIYSDSNYTDSKGRTYTADDHLPRVNGSGRSDIEKNGGTSDYPQCTDDPQGVDDTWKFEWEIKREKGGADSTTGKRNWEAYSGKMTLHNNLSESPLTIDTDNDNDQFGTDSEGKVLTEQVRTANVSMYYGTAVQALTSAPTLALRYDDGTAVENSVATAGVTEVSGSGGTRYMVTVTVKVTPSSASSVPFATHGGLYVDITAVCARGTKNIRFTLEKVMGGAPGINPLIYQLNPTLRVLPFAYNGDALVPASGRRVTVNVLETNGNTTTEKTSAIEGVTYDWGFDSDTKKNTDACAVGTYITITAEQAAAHSLVWLKLSTGDKETIPIVKDGKNGVSGNNAIRFSLDNEHEDFLYDGGSLVAPSGGASSQMRLYDGEVEKTSDATFEIFSVSGTTNSSSGAYVSGSMLYVKNITAASASVVVRAYYNKKYYYAEFTANRVTQDKYDIVLSPSSIAYNSATYQTQRVRVSAKGIGIGGTSITASISSMPHSGNLRAFWAYVSNNGSVGSMSRLSGDAVYKDVTASECANYAGIYFELRWYDNESTSDTATSGYRVCDFETVEIAKAENGADGLNGADGADGTDGADAAKAYATPEVITIPCNEDGSVTGIIEKSITFSMKAGSHSASLTGVTAGTRPTGVTTEAVSASAMKITISTSATAAGMAGGVTFTVNGSYGGKSYSVPVTVGLIGALKGARGEGQKGKAGRFYYYAGEFDRNNTTAAFLVSDSQAPYFKNIEDYYLFDYDVNGYYTMQDMYYIQNNFNLAPWVSMWNDFKYLITEAIFGNYAHFGSFIINRDWMLSQYGILVDNYGNKTTINASNVNTPFSTDGALTLNGNGINNGIIVCKLSFTLSASTTITATITPNSESNYDFGAVGAIDSYALGGATANDIKKNYISLLVKASGTTSATATTTTISAGSHYFYVAYAKDSSTTYGTDQASISLSFASGTVYYDLSVIKITEGMSYSGGSRISIPYGWFDAADPMAETLPSSGYKFVPNYAVDGLTGATYQNSAYVRGEIRASKYYMARQNIVMQNRGTEIVEDINEGVQVVIAESYSTNGTKNKLRLPSAANNAGMVVDIYYAIGAVPSLEYSVAPFRITSVSGEIVAVRTFFTRTDYPTLSYGQHVKVYSNGYSWIVLDDMDSYSSNLRAEVASIIQELRTNILKSLGASYVAFPDNIKTESFILPASPSNGMVIFCKGITSDLTISTLSHPIVWANSRDIQTAANSSVNIGDDSVILVFSAGKWIRFDCY